MGLSQKNKESRLPKNDARWTVLGSLRGPLALWQNTNGLPLQRAGGLAAPIGVDDRQKPVSSGTRFLPH